MKGSLEGQSIPEITFRTREGHEWVNVGSEQIFKNRKIVVFSLPGAFTPTCSSTHVPRYNQLAPVLKQQGIDEVICISVNDAFVMNEWQKQQKAEEITFLPDGNGEFTAALGMLVDKNDLGFGRRSWRYSMLVNDGVIEKMFIEPDLPGDPFVVSDADTMLAHVSPGCAIPDDVTIFSREGCEFCVKTKALLNEKGIQYNELVLNQDFNESTIRAVSGQSTLPQIFINGQLIGGSERLTQYFDEDKAA
ncbi:MAG: glutaredoxin-like protein [Gammaproteobacteria bacterium]|jgi:glutaredoxin-like protein